MKDKELITNNELYTKLIELHTEFKVFKGRQLLINALLAAIGVKALGLLDAFIK